MTLRQLLSGKYCPFTGIEVRILNTISHSKLADKPPGYYYCLADSENVENKEPENPAQAPYITPPKKAGSRGDRTGYFKAWYQSHKQHKHDLYVKRKIKNANGNKN